MPNISVIMGIYNCEKTLDESIQSIINQTYTDWELILCDDSSIDNTYNIARSYQNQYKNIVLLKNKQNMGLHFSLNRCLEMARGQYIARMDGDDISLPERFQRQSCFLDEYTEYSLVGSSVILFDETGEKAIRNKIEYPRKNDLIFSVPFVHPTVMIRREVLDNLNGYTVLERTKRCEDVDLWFKLYAQGYKGYNVQTPLLKYHESLSDYSKRSFKVRWQGMKTRYIGYKRLNIPFRYYITLLKPLIAWMVPHRVMYFYHKSIKGR